MDDQALVKPSEGPSYHRTDHAEHQVMVQLHLAGKSYEAIAEQLGRSISTVHDVVKRYVPTVDLAKRRLDAVMLDMVENVAQHGSPTDHTKLISSRLLQEAETKTFNIYLDGFKLHGTGRPDAIDGEVLSPPQLEDTSEGQQNR